MKTFVTLGLGLCVAIAFTSCKSQETAYKKAYEKAKQQQAVEQQQPTEQAQTTTQVAVAPVQTTTTVTRTATEPVSDSDANVRTESVQLIDGAGLKNYSVVCGSFSLKTNAQAEQQRLKNKGYAAQIAYNGKVYRVVASTFEDRASAVSSRNTLREAYPDAWLLYNK